MIYYLIRLKLNHLSNDIACYLDEYSPYQAESEILTFMTDTSNGLFESLKYFLEPLFESNLSFSHFQDESGFLIMYIKN